MDSTNSKREFIKSALEANINRRAAVSLFDRFGGSSAVFEKQFQDAQHAVRAHGALKREAELGTLVRKAGQRFEALKRERSILSQPRDLPRVADIDALVDAVADLKEEVAVRLDALEENGEETPTHSSSEIKDTIVRWRLDDLPPVCPETP
nr:ORF35 [Human gammaherpesvirus 8]